MADLARRGYQHKPWDDVVRPDYLAPTMPAPPRDLVDREIRRADVPCGKCRLCCQTLIVPLAVEEYAQYDWAWICKPDGTRLSENARALKRKPNGDCIYLDERGCSIHGRAPHVCQRFDCRELFLSSDRAGRRQAIRSGKIPKSLFDRGREMVRAAEKEKV
jgi:hypothetical protein